MLFLFALSALAMPQGSPVPDPRAARVAIGARLDTDVSVLAPVGCAGSDCAQRLSRTAMGGALEIALLPGVGLQADLMRVTLSDDDDAYTGQGPEGALALKLSHQLTGAWGVAASARARWLKLPQQASAREARLSAAGTWGLPDDGFVAWVGAQVPVFIDVEIPPSDEQTSWNELEAGRPVSATFGISMLSSRLGAPWRHTARASVGLEGWAGQDNGVSAWLGLAL